MRGKKTFHFYDLHFFHAKAKKNVLYSVSGKCARRSKNIRTRTHTSISSCENLIKTTAHTQSQTKGMQPTSRGKTTIAWERRQKNRSPEECERHTKSSRGKSRKSTCFHPVAKKTLSEWQRHCSVKCHCWVKNSSENSSNKKDEPKMELTFRNALTFWNVEIIEENPWTRSNFRNVFFSTHPRKWPSLIRGALLVHCSKFTTEVTKLKH